MGDTFSVLELNSPNCWGWPWRAPEEPTCPQTSLDPAPGSKGEGGSREWQTGKLDRGTGSAQSLCNCVALGKTPPPSVPEFPPL